MNLDALLAGGSLLFFGLLSYGLIAALVERRAHSVLAAVVVVAGA